MPQREYFGLGSVKKIGDIILRQRAEKVFLVRGRKSYRDSGAKKIIEPLLEKYLVFQFCDFESNPKVEDVVRGIDKFKKFNPDLVVAVGGGSVIDMAKAVNLLAAQTGKPEEYIIGKKEIQNQGKKLIALPTTFGSGSETTCFAVVYIDKVKYSLTHKYLLPDYALIAPELTFNLPKKIAAESGADALAQAIESYWSVNSTNQSKKYSREAIRLIVGNLSAAVNKLDKEARAAMCRAAHLAGKAINISQTTACHALSYPMTSYFGAPHGQAAVLTLPALLVYNSQIEEKNNLDKRGAKYVKKTMAGLIKALGARNVEQAKKKIDNLIREIGLKTKLSELGIGVNGQKIILENINLERMKNNPRKLDKKEIEKILINLK